MKSKKILLLLFSGLIIKILAISLTNFNLFGDEAQYWVWSQNLDIGYYSKPPLIAWFLSVFVFFLGDGFVSLKLFSIFFYIFSTILIYFLSYELFKNKKFSLMVAISFYFMPVVSVSSFLISTDVILVFFWILSLVIVLRIRAQTKLVNFLLLGIFLGLAFLAKYAAIYFLLSLFMLFFLDKKTKSIFLNNKLGLFIFVSSFIIIILPNLLWNIQNDWITISHTSDNMGLARMSLNLFQGFEFLFIQALMIGPVLVFGFLISMRNFNFNFEDKFLLIFSLPIFIIVLLESILVRANANWAAAGLVCLFLFLFVKVYKFSIKIINFNIILNFIFSFIFFVLIATTSQIQIFNRISEISLFANLLEKNYLINTKYLVVNDRLLYSSLRYSLRDSGVVIYTPYKSNEPVKSHFQITDPLLSTFNKNFIFIGDPLNINYLNEKIKIIKLKEINVIFKKKPIKIYEVTF